MQPRFRYYSDKTFCILLIKCYTHKSAFQEDVKNLIEIYPFLILFYVNHLEQMINTTTEAKYRKCHVAEAKAMIE